MESEDNVAKEGLTLNIRDGDSVSVTVLKAVYEEETGTAAMIDDLIDLPPLYETVNPEALDSLFAPTNSTDREGSVSFRYAGHTIEVRGCELVTVW